MKKILILALLFGLSLSLNAYAYKIVLVSDSLAPETTPGVGDHCDDPLVAFLEGLGHTVDRSGMDKNYRNLDAAKIANMESAGLVVVSRRTSSGAYDDGTEKSDWNELTTPLLLQSGYLTRSGKWGWTTGGSGNVDGTVTDCDWVGVDDDALLLPNAMFDWTSVGGTSPKGPFLPNVAGGESVAGTITVEFDGRPWVISIPKGTDLDALNGTTDTYGTTGEWRVFMGAYGYDNPGTHEWGDLMTEEYEGLFASLVNTMIPEPATIALLGLGGLALIRRRRR
jgi:hypothetical protein